MNSGSCLLLFLFLFLVPLSKSSSFKTFSDIISPKSLHSSIVFPLSGNVFPLGYYSVLLQIGNPPKNFHFDVDTGSDLTWVECNAPCSGCTLSPILQYKPHANTVPCSDPICSALHWPSKPYCPNPKEQCDYEVEYADQGSSLGALVIDQFPFKLHNGTILQPRLAFGCGYHQSFPKAYPETPIAGVLGLGRGRISILSQLVSAGLTRKMFGHCLSSKGGGYLFFGDNLIPSTSVAWTPLLSNEDHYTTGPAEIVFNGKPTGLKGLKLIFDTGSSYTYFNTKTYQTIVKMIENDLKKVTQIKDAKEDKTLPICWKGAKPFKSVLEVKNFFKTITINFTNGGKNNQLQIPPESYLILSKTGNVCLGLLNGSEVGLQDTNIIGDISMQGLMIIYDNEKQQVGWVSSDCNNLPNTTNL